MSRVIFTSLRIGLSKLPHQNGLRNYHQIFINSSKLIHNPSKNLKQFQYPKILSTSKSCVRCYCDSKSKIQENATTTVDADQDDLTSHELGSVKAARMYLSFTCTVCNGPNEFTISKQAYVSGVVIVTCKTCQNNHLIADNLNWFTDVKGKNIEDIMAEKGEKVTRFVSSQVNEIIPKED